jgi:hypothetical protein
VHPHLHPGISDLRRADSGLVVGRCAGAVVVLQQQSQSPQRRLDTRRPTQTPPAPPAPPGTPKAQSTRKHKHNAVGVGVDNAQRARAQHVFRLLLASPRPHAVGGWAMRANPRLAFQIEFGVPCPVFGASHTALQSLLRKARGRRLASFFFLLSSFFFLLSSLFAQSGYPVSRSYALPATPLSRPRRFRHTARHSVAPTAKSEIRITSLESNRSYFESRVLPSDLALGT